MPKGAALVSGNTQEHYDRLADSYDENWAQSASFIEWMVGQILGRLDLGPDDHAVDLGCGTGLFSAALGKHARDVACVDPSPGMLRNLRLPATGTFVPIQATAEQVASRAVRLPHEPADAVLVKEAIHHVADRDSVIGQLAGLLAPGGRLLVVMLPTAIGYPLFGRALEEFTRIQPDPGDIARAMERGGLVASVTYDSYQLEFPRDRYLAMVRDRYMSLLSLFSDAELEDGIREISDRYPMQRLRFEDRFAFVLGRRPLWRNWMSACRGCKAS
jgi:SAM-dependent methyltransferase